jgi:hypothetical protein
MTRNFVVLCSAVFLFAVWLALPALHYNQGTARNIGVEVVAEPFTTGDNLIYRLSADLMRSCDVNIRRVIIDSDNVVTNLTTLVFGALPSSGLGPVSFELIVPVPLRIAEGPAIYQVTEVPRCSWMQRMFPVGVPYPPVHFTVTR